MSFCTQPESTPIDGLETRADHGDVGGRRNSYASRECREPGIGGLHLAAEPAEAACAGLADALQFGAHLSYTDRGEADADAFFSHRGSSQDDAGPRSRSQPS